MSLYVCLLYGADGTLTDEASDKLLLLDGCADTALEVAFVEHDSRWWWGLSVCYSVSEHICMVKVYVMVLSCVDRH